MTFELPMAPSQTDEISCSSCTAACCRKGMVMQMTKAEVSRHRRQMDLKTILKPRDYPQALPATERVIKPDGQVVEGDTTIDVPSYHGLFVLESDCGYLEGNKCTIYDDPHKPDVCTEFEVGSQACRLIREASGIDNLPQ